MAAIPAGDPPLLAGVELGGTKCVCILARGPGDIVEQESLPTLDPAATIARIRDILSAWSYGALGIASFGPIDLAEGAIAATPKPGWAGVSLRSMAPDPRGKIVIDTDVNGAALAEGRWGAARNLSSWAYITVGTGIGVGSIVEGRPIRGLGHSEAGHMRIPQGSDSWSGVCPFHGDCVEGLASGPAIAARAGAAGATLAADHPVWSGVADALAALCHNLVLTSLPQRILIGGGVATGRPELLGMIRARLDRSLAGYGPGAGLTGALESFLVAPALGAMAGPMGAIALAAEGAE